MINQESLAKVDAIIEAHGADMTEQLGNAASVREQLGDARVAVGDAEAAVKLAEEEHSLAEKRVRSLESERQGSQRSAEFAAKKLAVDIIRDEDVDPVTKTLSSLIYTDSSISWKETADPYAEATARGRTALSSIMERLKSGEPILHFPRGKVVAGVATDESLAASPPKVVGAKLEEYISLQGGSIDIIMPDASSAVVAAGGLVQVTRGAEQLTLISNNYEHDFERLEVAANNGNWLVVGTEGIAAKLEQLDPVQQLVALTALRAVGVEPPIRAAEEVRQQTEQQIVALVAFLASGVGQETTTKRVVSRNAWAGGVHHTQVTQNKPLTRMAQDVDAKSIKFMSETIGLSRQDLRDKVEAQLKSRVENDSTRLDQLAKDVQSLATLDKILDVIF